MRYFPSASRRRALRAPGRSCVPLVGALASPVATQVVVPARSADATTSRTSSSEVQQQIEHAQDEAEESSNRRAPRPPRRSTTPRPSCAAPGPTWPRHASAAGRRPGARRRMQAELTRRAARLMPGPAPTWPPARRRCEAQRAVGQGHGHRPLPAGRPELLASLSGYLDAKSPVRPDPAGWRRRQRGRASRTACTPTWTPPRRCCRSARTRCEDAKRRGGRPAPRGRRATSSRCRGCSEQAAGRRSTRSATWSTASRGAAAGDARRAQARPGRARAAQGARRRIKQQILAAAPRQGRAAAATTGPATDGFLAARSTARVTSPFGYRTHPIYGYYGLHNGTDFGAGCGSPLRAGAAGTVISHLLRRGLRQPALPQRRHASTAPTSTLVYNHMSGYHVGDGARVGRGDVVGYVGTTGWSTGCHLHFTVLRNGNPVDPDGLPVPVTDCRS